MSTNLTTRAIPAERRERFEPPRRGVLSDIVAVWQRETLTILRDPFSVIFSLLQPLVFLGLFAPLLAGVSGEGQQTTLQWFLPGVVVMITMFGTSMTGSNLQFEIMTGSFERILAPPCRGPRCSSAEPSRSSRRWSRRRSSSC